MFSSGGRVFSRIRNQTPFESEWLHSFLVNPPATEIEVRPSCLPRPSELRGNVRGVEGTEPLVSRSVQHCVGWLDHTNSGPSQPGERPQNAPARRPRRQSYDRRGQPPLPLGRGPHGRRGQRATRVTSLAITALSADRRFSPYLYPSGTRDRRSPSILWPVGYPKSLWKTPKRPLSPSRGRQALRTPERYAFQSATSRYRRSNRPVRRCAASIWVADLVSRLTVWCLLPSLSRPAPCGVEHRG
jgi:hypothetical protein